MDNVETKSRDLLENTVNDDVENEGVNFPRKFKLLNNPEYDNYKNKSVTVIRPSVQVIRPCFEENEDFNELVLHLPYGISNTHLNAMSLRDFEIDEL